MLRYHMAVVTQDKSLKREVKRVTTATGSTAQFVHSLSEVGQENPVHLAILDSRAAIIDASKLPQTPQKAKIIHILNDGSITDRLNLFKDPRTASLLCHDERFDDDEFICSATKALRGDVFGLQKYFPWGVTTFSMIVESYEQKGLAIDVLMEYAKLAGVRGPVRDRIQLVCDELTMNALYHAPMDQSGTPLYEGKSPRELAQLEQVKPVQIQYGCSGRYFGISVRDGGGSLTRKKALEYLIRAKTGSHIESKVGGAGLGLVSVLQSVSKLIFNLDPGYSTEVIGLFDMELFARGKVGARSVHIFEAAQKGPEEDTRAATASPIPMQGMWRWGVAAILLAIVAGLGTAYFMKAATAAKLSSNSSSTAMHINVLPNSATPTIIVNEQPFTSPGKLPTQNPVHVRVTAPGYKDWNYTLTTQKGNADQHIQVHLVPQ